MSSLSTPRPRPRSRPDARRGGRRRPRPYRGADPETRRRQRWERLVEAGFERIGTRGFEATGVGDVCREARVATRYFYESFASKEELLGAVLDRVVARARRRVVAALAEAPDEPRARLERGLRAFVAAYLDDPRSIRIALVEVVGRGAAIERQRRRYLGEFASLIAQEAERFARRGRIRLPIAPERVGIAMAGLIHELIVDWMVRADPAPKDELCDEIMALLDVVLRGAESSRHE